MLSHSLRGFLLSIYVIFSTIWGDYFFQFFGGLLQLATANTSQYIDPAKYVPFGSPV